MSDIDTRFSEEFRSAIEQVLIEDYKQPLMADTNDKSMNRTTPFSSIADKTNDHLVDNKVLNIYNDSEEMDGGESEEESSDEKDKKVNLNETNLNCEISLFLSSEIESLTILFLRNSLYLEWLYI